MRTVASALSVEMKRLIDYVDLVTALHNAARLPLTPLRGRKVLTVAIAEVHTRTRSLSRGESLAFEGAYLSSCAMFEEAVRDMIEVCVDRIAAKKPVYVDLPDKMKKAHLDGCGMILCSLKQDRFSHLTESVIISNLASCYCSPTPPATSSYSLTSEAFSSHTNNFRPEVLAASIGKLGVDDLWNKLGQKPSLLTHFRAGTAIDTKRFSMGTLESVMLKRNGIIHRGPSFVPPTGAEAKDAALFFSALADALANVLEDYVVAI